VTSSRVHISGASLELRPPLEEDSFCGTSIMEEILANWLNFRPQFLQMQGFQQTMGVLVQQIDFDSLKTTFNMAESQAENVSGSLQTTFNLVPSNNFTIHHSKKQYNLFVLDSKFQRLCIETFGACGGRRLTN